MSAGAGDDDRDDSFCDFAFPETWIEWHCRRRGFEWLCEVELAFIGAAARAAA